MPTIINASTSAGAQIIPDNSGVIQLQSNGANTVQIAANGAVSPAGSIFLPAGTTSIAPLDFTAGTNLTTPIAGAMEYDGRVIYGTPQGTQRGAIPANQIYRLDTAFVGGNVNTAQAILGTGVNGVAVTLSSSTVYAFEAMYVWVKTAGTTSHTFAIGFGGTATVNNILYEGRNNNFNAALPVPIGTGGSDLVVNTASSQVITGAITNAAQTVMHHSRGTISINAGGTFIPQYTLSAAPGGAYTTQIGSYFMIYPIGTSGSNISVGTWA